MEEKSLKLFSNTAFVFEIIKILLLTYGKSNAIRLKLRFKDSTVLRPLIVSISNINNIHICKNVFIHAGLVLRILDDCKLLIGEDTYIGPNTHISGTKGIINIGKKVMIADNVLISTVEHEYKDVMLSIKDQGDASRGNIIIGEGSWIGQGSIIMSGVIVGKNSVVGANSVVTRNIPSFTVAAGSPARIIKQYNTEQKKWLNKDI